MEKIDSQQPEYIVGVALKGNSKIYDYDANSMNFRVGDMCIVETDWGVDIGVVAASKRKANCCKKKLNQCKKILKIASKEDLEKSSLNDQRTKEAFQFCMRKIGERKIPMKLFKVNMNLEGSKLKYYYTAEKRVDFRALLKDLSQRFKMKIEMRQIGVRDEAKILGGCGPCGEKLCCARFLKDFEPVSIRMAKNQNLALNPLKITGVCGRLLCCLIYENETYKELRKNIPKNGKSVKTPEGEGTVINSDIIQQKIFVELEDGQRSHFSVDDIEVIFQPKKLIKTNNQTKPDNLNQK